MRPSISLLVPCYNAEDYICDLLAIAKTQTWPYHEIICYDDASRDQTVSLIETQNVPVIRSDTNHGPAYARKALLTAANGDFVHFHDADDLLSHRFVEVISPVLSPQTAGFCARSLTDESGKTRKIAQAEFSDGLELVVRNFIHFNQTVFPAGMARKYMTLAEDLRILEDRLAFLSMAANGLKFRYVDEVLTTIVRRAGSVTASQSHADGMDCLLSFWNRAVPLAGEQAQALANYASYTAWCYYFEDVSVYPQLKKIMQSIRKAGLAPLQKASRSEQHLARLVAPEWVYWLRRQRANYGNP